MRPSPHFRLPRTGAWRPHSMSGPLQELIGSRSKSLRPELFICMRQLLPAYLACEYYKARTTLRKPCLLALHNMDFWIIAAVTMLVGWAWITFTTTAPGWVHLLLTAGVFVLIWRIVLRGTSDRQRR